MIYFFYSYRKRSGTKRLRIDAFRPLIERVLPILINDEAGFGPKVQADMPMLNVQIGRI